MKTPHYCAFAIFVGAMVTAYLTLRGMSPLGALFGGAIVTLLLIMLLSTAITD